MIEMIAINEDYFRDKLAEAQKRDVPTLDYAGIYSHMAGYYLDEAINTASAEAVKAINYDDPEYATLAVSIEEAARHASTINLGDSECWIKLDDIAKRTNSGWVVEGTANIAKFMTRETIANFVRQKTHQRPEIKRLFELGSHTWLEGSLYTALDNFAPGYRGNPFAALAEVQAYARGAMRGVYDGESREKHEVDRSLEKLDKELEKLIVQLSQKLLVKRRDAIQTALQEGEYSTGVQGVLQKGLDAANQSVQQMDSHVRIMAASKLIGT